MTKRDIILQFIKRAVDMNIGELLYLPCVSDKKQRALLKAISDEINTLGQIDPVTASELVAAPIFQDKRQWVVIKKVPASPTTAFIKEVNGLVKRIDLNDDSDKIRRLKLMAKDGLSLEEIQDIEGDLTEKEVEFLKGVKDET